MLGKSTASWTIKGTGASLLLTWLTACSTVPNDGVLFKPTGRVLKDATVLRVEFDGNNLREISRRPMSTIPLMYNVNSTPPLFGRCFYKVVVGFDYSGTRLVEEFIERRCPPKVTGFVPIGPYNSGY